MATETVSADPAWWDSWRGVLFANARVLHAVEATLQEHSGISLAVMDALGRLFDSPQQRLRMQELQEQSLFTSSGMTRLIDRLTDAGFVTRESVPGDRRGVLVVLTSEGARRYADALEKHRTDIEREFGRRLGLSQHKAVAAALDQFWHE
ncbi:MAG: MarR family transcriptional regulator [Dehalococcoidia bacterium]|jgi:DNA-binding MarR family transcriptional regulator|nr:MarR family transcriptional regulator [Dehalococcoidia bacterium]